MKTKIMLLIIVAIIACVAMAAPKPMSLPAPAANDDVNGVIVQHLDQNHLLMISGKTKFIVELPADHEIMKEADQERVTIRSCELKGNFHYGSNVYKCFGLKGVPFMGDSIAPAAGSPMAETIKQLQQQVADLQNRVAALEKLVNAAH